MQTAQPIALSETLTGHLTVNGRKVSPQIQMLFRQTTDTLHPWRSDAKERFLTLMTDAGLAPQAKAIINAHALA